MFISIEYPLSFRECPGCKKVASTAQHDFSLCTELRNAEYRIRELEMRVTQVEGSKSAACSAT
jgi:hypothetical protein